MHNAIVQISEPSVSDVELTPAYAAPAPLGIYVHVPFCQRKCPYCDFNTYAGLEEHFDALVGALCKEMTQGSDALRGRQVTSIFVGGGTPTVLSHAQLSCLFETLFRAFQLAPGCEITCEANPGTVDRDKFRHLRGLGVNRLSLGVQSFQPSELTFLGRIHDVDDVVRAVESARDADFHNINLDFIFGLPGQALPAWDATLTKALALNTEHLSLYSLIVEPNTPLHHWVDTGRVAAPDEDVAAALYEHAMVRLADAGYAHYEVSNWAKAAGGTSGTHAIGDAVDSVDVNSDDVDSDAVDSDAVDSDGVDSDDVDSEALSAYVCRHNLLYWRNQEYVGIGPGAHSHLRDGTASRRWSNRKPVPGYIRRMQAGDVVVDMEETPSPAVARGETMMMGLRLVQEGVGLARFRAQHGCELAQVFAAEQASLVQAGLIQVTPSRVRVTPRGLLFANQVAETFLAV